MCVRVCERQRGKKTRRGADEFCMRLCSCVRLRACMVAECCSPVTVIRRLHKHGRRGEGGERGGGGVMRESLKAVDT